ncbi:MULTISPECIES: helix-turn-helix domain-containing protein [unclassified Curtobacterium]|uniref:helix-turn-helix domain-containing protein n=1 Tax=unclassified Curtobacterium TaxID=257496 RepID=UPI000DA95B3D|nr:MULTISPECIES: helix-turn-helix transcriptional regulator [unclassified Curtobacterium]PZE64080.1 transcriptional regulator [Curtobacterium sp. MCBD17_021]WIB25981.1 helix-turn-helix transcriptional regulator [Curtobacterium sp. MCSS17_015]
MVRLPLTPLDLERGRRLGAVLRSARGERSMLDVALAAGISPETLRKIETGRIATPSFATVAALAGVLGLSLDAVWAQACGGTPRADGPVDHPGDRSGIVMDSEPRGLPVA